MGLLFMTRIGSFLFILFFSPVTFTFAQVCVDSDPVGDGWGWNGTSSCRVTEVPDEDPGDLASTCVDTDPLGDGWGWNGTASCRVGATPQQPTQQCIDTDPVGDGWGWNGIESCMVLILLRWAMAGAGTVLSHAGSTFRHALSMRLILPQLE